MIDVPASRSWPTIDKMMLTGAARSHYDLDPSFPGTTADTRARETFHDATRDIVGSKPVLFAESRRGGGLESWMIFR